MNDNDYGLRDVLGLIRRQYRLILLTIVLLLGSATALTFTMRPIYSASTMVMVDTTHKDLLAPESTNVPSQDSPRIDSEVELVGSETTLMRVLKDEHLMDLPEFGINPNVFDSVLYALRIKRPVEATPDDLVDAAYNALSSSLSVDRVGLTYLIAISARSADPETAARIANAVASAYVDEQLASKINVILAASNAIKARIAEANKAVATSEDAFDTFISDNLEHIAAITGRSDLVASRTELESAIHAGTTLATQVQAGVDSLASRNWDALATTLRDDAIAKLAADRARLEAGLSAQGANQSLRDQLSRIDAQLEARASASLSMLRSQLAETQSTSSELRRKLRTDVLSADLPADTLASIYTMQQSAEIARNQYQTLLARAKDLETQAYLQVPDSRIVSSATPPAAPTFPNKRLILSIAGVIGLIGGLGVALLYENVIGGFTSAEQLGHFARTTVTASIPRQTDLKVADRQHPSLTLADYQIAAPLSSYAESIRRLRVGIDQAVRRAKAARGENSDHAVIMITSAAPGEGKTTTALALARAYATSGYTTLLVDCDLRKPSLHRQLGVEPSVGLLEYLAQPGEGRSLRSIVTTDTLTGVQVVVGARQSDVATDQFVTGQSFARLISAARQSFDVVILDTPPVGPVVDGLYVAGSVDAIALLVRFGKTPQREVRGALTALGDAKAASTEILAVLNQADIRTQPYRGQYGA